MDGAARLDALTRATDTGDVAAVRALLVTDIAGFTALHAVALDPGGSADLGGLLTAVDSGLTIRRTLSRGHGPAGDEPLRPWGIPAHISKLPKGQVLPRGFVMWPPPMA